MNPRENDVGNYKIVVELTDLNILPLTTKYTFQIDIISHLSINTTNKTDNSSDDN